MSFYVGFRHFILEYGSPEVVIPVLIWYVTAIRSCDVNILCYGACSRIGFHYVVGHGLDRVTPMLRIGDPFRDTSQRDSTSYLSTYWHRVTTNDLSDCGEQR